MTTRSRTFVYAGVIALPAVRIESAAEIYIYFCGCMVNELELIASLVALDLI